MSGQIDVSLPALREYAGKNAGLADDVRGEATGRLAALRALPADMFGDLGTESGLHGHLGTQVGELRDHVEATASAIGSLGDAVTGAHADYQYNERDDGARFDRLNTQP